MTTMTDDMPINELSRRLGVVEGRLDEMSVALQDLKEGQRELGRRLDQIDQRINDRVDKLNDRLFQLLLAVIGVGGVIFAALVGLIITLILQGGGGS